MSESVVDADLERLRELTGEHMIDLVYTYKTFFKMARISYFVSQVADVVVIVFSLGLVDSLLRGTLPPSWNIRVAGLIALVAFIDRGFNFNKKGHQFERAADSYNSLFKECREFYKLELSDESVSIDEKRSRLQQLTERHRELNSLTPSTWDFAYRLLNEEDVLGNVEVTEEEHDRIL